MRTSPQGAPGLPPKPGPASGPRAKQRELPLLRIELPQRADHRLQAADLVLRITGIERATLDPRGRALLPQGEFALGFGNLFGTCDHHRVPLWEGERLAQRSRMSLSAFAPPAVVGPVAVPT